MTLEEAKRWMAANEHKDYIWTALGAWKWLRWAVAELEAQQMTFLSEVPRV